MNGMHEKLRAAWVIGRRDFTAVIFSKAFFFFLLGPLFPLAIGLAAGGISSQVSRDITRPEFAMLMDAAESDRLLAAREGLAEQLGSRGLPDLSAVAVAGAGDTRERIDALLAGDTKGKTYIAVLSGTIDAPELTGPAQHVERWEGAVQLILANARNPQSGSQPPIRTRVVADSSGAREQTRLITAQMGQAVLVLLIMLLAGMVLSNLVEEKTNKIIEILAAAVPIDSIFLGKLVAMLAMALIGIAVWTAMGIAAITLSGGGVPVPPPPAIGWPLFILLSLTYFAMAYLLLGSLFLGIGAMASTVREVQTLSMPVTMGQLLVFFLAAYSVNRMGEPIELFAAIFPFSSPFAMLARAAQTDMLWPHLLAIVWQLLWVLVIVRIGASMFRRNVLKSGQAGAAPSPGPLKRLFSRSGA